MAAFLPAFEKMIDNEGGYTLHRVEGDRGGATYAGIARNFHPDWEGWPLLDAGAPDSQLIPHVAAFYQQHFWERIRGDFIDSQRVAETLFDFAVMPVCLQHRNWPRKLLMCMLTGSSVQNP